uniref:Multidrug and toxin extrusion protein n=1 Tax=Macrostomum lignano TaxID=282301 RepID=A0A1I8FS67_9PLAT
MAWQDYADEIRWLVRTGAPISVTQLFYSLVMPTTLAFCGYLGKEELDSAGLAISIFQLSVANFASAVRWGIMPFLAHTMAGSKPARDPAIAVNTEMYFLLLSPGCLGIIAFRALVAYTDTLGRLWPTLLVHVIGFLVNLLLQYVLVLHTDLGLAGSAIALSVTLVLLAVFQAIFIWRLRLYKDTWTGWSPRAFLGWGKFFGGMLPAIGTQTLWIFGTEVGNFLAGLLGKSEIAAESLLFQINFLAFLLPVGLGSAVIARVGAYLSQQEPERAKRTSRASLLFMSVTGLLVGGIFMALRFQIPKLYSLDAESTNLFVSLMPYLAVYTTLQLIAYPCVATLRACNHHVVAMVINFIAYYVVSLPLGVSLTFAAGWGLRGLWVGFVSASATFLVLLLLAMLRSDWRRRSNLAHADAEFETDAEAPLAAGERAPLLMAEEDDAEDWQLLDRQQKQRQQRGSSNRQVWWPAVRAKLPVLGAAVLALLASATIRVVAPPRIPLYPMANASSWNSTLPPSLSAHTEVVRRAPHPGRVPPLGLARLRGDLVGHRLLAELLRIGLGCEPPAQPVHVHPADRPNAEGAADAHRVAALLEHRPARLPVRRQLRSPHLDAEQHLGALRKLRQVRRLLVVRRLLLLSGGHQVFLNELADAGQPTLQQRRVWHSWQKLTTSLCSPGQYAACFSVSAIFSGPKWPPMPSWKSVRNWRRSDSGITGTSLGPAASLNARQRKPSWILSFRQMRL